MPSSTSDIRRPKPAGDPADIDALREFYHSAAKDYQTYKKKKKAAAAAPAGGAEKTVAQGSAAAAAKSRKAPPSADPDLDEAAAATRIQALHRGRKAREELADAQAAPPFPESYLLFLRQEQDLEHCHDRMGRMIDAFSTHVSAQSTDMERVRGKAAGLLRSADGSDGWNLVSEYNTAGLIADAELVLAPDQLLHPRDVAQEGELRLQAAAFGELRGIEHPLQRDGLRGDYSRAAPPYDAFDGATQAAVAAFGAAAGEAAAGRCDAAALSRVPDALLTQLRHVCATPPLLDQVRGEDEATDRVRRQLADEEAARQAALGEGNMQVAEQNHFSVVALFEEVQHVLIDKIGVIDRSRKEVETWEAVRGEYSAKAAESVAGLRRESEALRDKAEGDLRRVAGMRRRIEEVERSVAAARAEGVARSNDALARNAARAEACWSRIAEAGRELRELEAERYAAARRRVDEKVREEQRRSEYDRFCAVCGSHSALLRDTSECCSAFLRATALVDDAVAKGFATLQADFACRSQESADLLAATHAAHLETFRGLFLSLGDLTHKLERRIEDTDKQIEAATINLELCADTLNPEAKRHSDVKRDLIAKRAELDEGVKELKKRAAKSLERFKPTEAALRDAGTAFTHPMLEQRQRAVAARERMLEFREMAITGKDETGPVQGEIDGLKRDLALLRERDAAAGAP